MQALQEARRFFLTVRTAAHLYARRRQDRLLFEVQVETPQLILGADGTAVVARCVHAAEGRLSALHYGTYDYSAALGIAAPVLGSRAVSASWIKVQPSVRL